MSFNFYAPTKLVTGKGCVITNAALIKSLGDKCFIVTSGTAGEKSGALKDIKDVLDSVSIKYEIHDSVAQNPLLDDAFSAGKKANSFGADFIVGIGGGSPLDASKAAAIFAANPDLEIMELFDLNWKKKALPIVVVGTTAGTGSEVNGFSVLTKPDGKKQSILHDQCYPTLAFGDSKYTASLPLNFTISTALDALSHSIEGYFSSAANRISDIFAIEAVKVLKDCLIELEKVSIKEDITPELRENLYYASVAAGYTLGICGTLYCHALSYFLSEDHDIPHGYACAVYLPGFLERERSLLPEKSARLEKEAGISIADLIELIKKLTPEFDVTMNDEEIQKLVHSKVATNNFIRTAPNGFSQEEGEKVLKSLFG